MTTAACVKVSGAIEASSSARPNPWRSFTERPANCFKKSRRRSASWRDWDAEDVVAAKRLEFAVKSRLTMMAASRDRLNQRNLAPLVEVGKLAENVSSTIDSSNCSPVSHFKNLHRALDELNAKCSHKCELLMKRLSARSPDASQDADKSQNHSCRDNLPSLQNDLKIHRSHETRGVLDFVSSGSMDPQAEFEV